MLEILSRTSHKPGNNPAAHAMQAPESPHHRVLLNSPTIIRGVVLLLTLLELFELCFIVFLDACTSQLFFFGHLRADSIVIIYTTSCIPFDCFRSCPSPPFGFGLPLLWTLGCLVVTHHQSHVSVLAFFAWFETIYWRFPF